MNAHVLIRVAMLTTFAVASRPTAAASAVVCPPSGKPVKLEVVQVDGSVAAELRVVGSTARRLDGAVQGSARASAPARAAPDGSVVAAEFVSSDGRPAVALWRASARPMTFAGTLENALFPKNGRVAAILSVIGDPASGEVEDRVFDRGGRLIASRVRDWQEEGYESLALSLDGSVVHLRPTPGASSRRVVELFDAASLSLVGTVSIEGLVIDDVVALTRERVFFTAGGAVFLSEDRGIRALGGQAPAMRFESLDVDPATRRVLARGPGGYSVFDVNGVEVSVDRNNTPLDGTHGFTADGAVLQGAVAGLHPLRTRDAATGAVLAEFAGGLSSTPGPDQIKCAYRDVLFVGAELDALALQRASPP